MHSWSLGTHPTAAPQQIPQIWGPWTHQKESFQLQSWFKSQRCSHKDTSVSSNDGKLQSVRQKWASLQEERKITHLWSCDSVLAAHTDCMARLRSLRLADLWESEREREVGRGVTLLSDLTSTPSKFRCWASSGASSFFLLLFDRYVTKYQPVVSTGGRVWRGEAPSDIRNSSQGTETEKELCWTA